MKSKCSTKKVGTSETDTENKPAVTKTYPGETGNTSHSCLNHVKVAVDAAKESGGKLPSIDRNISHLGSRKNVSEYSHRVRENGPILPSAGRLATTGDGSKGMDDTEALA